MKIATVDDFVKHKVAPEHRAIVARRPIGLEHPQSPAARALRDVARLVLEDARIPLGA